jgi:enamine deaminase RidA (YjgF/YER057c/UK114 family)
MPLKLDNPATLSPPLGLYSHTVEVPAGARLVFVSGQVAVRPDGTLPATLEEQADQVYANIVAALVAKNVPPSCIIKLTTFMVDDDPAGLIRKARVKHLGNHRPASTAVYVTRLVDPAWKVEIEAVAMVPENR